MARHVGGAPFGLVYSVAATGALLAFGALLLLAFRSERRVTRGIAAKVDARPKRDVLFGPAIGLAIAGYTLVESEGLDHADPLAWSSPPCSRLAVPG